MRLLGVMEIGRIRPAKKARAKEPVASRSARTAILFAAPKPKIAAAIRPSTAAITTEPEPPKAGMTSASAPQPTPAPTRSKAYRRFTRGPPRVIKP